MQAYLGFHFRCGETHQDHTGRGEYTCMRYCQYPRAMSQEHLLDLFQRLGNAAYASELRLLAGELDPSDQFGKRNGSLHRALGRLRKWGTVKATVGEHGCFLYSVVKDE